MTSALSIIRDSLSSYPSSSSSCQPTEQDNDDIGTGTGLSNTIKSDGKKTDDIALPCNNPFPLCNNPFPLPCFPSSSSSSSSPTSPSTNTITTAASTTSTENCPTHPATSSFVKAHNPVLQTTVTAADNSTSSLSFSSPSPTAPLSLHLDPSTSSSASVTHIKTTSTPATTLAPTAPVPLVAKPSYDNPPPPPTTTGSTFASPSWLHPFRKLKPGSNTNPTTNTHSSVSAANISSVSFISSNSLESTTTPTLSSAAGPNSSLPSPSLSLPRRNSSSFNRRRIRSFSFSNDNSHTRDSSSSGDTSFLRKMVELARNHTMPAVPSSSSSFSGRRNSTQNAINTRANTTVFAFATITLPKTLSNKGLDGYGNTTADLSNLTSRSLSSSSAAGAATDGTTAMTMTTTATTATTTTIPLAPIISAIQRGNFLALSEPLLDILIRALTGKNSTALETINIAGAAISASDAKLLARLIRSSSAANIKILKLARNAISQQALKYIFEAWKYNQTITTLSLARSGINDNTIKYISKVLAKNETIRELDLSSNRITAPGMEVLAEGLVYNRALVRLCLQSNNIKKAGAPFLARLLTKNKVLRHLNVGSNGLGSEGCVMIAEAVRFNRTLNSLSLDMNEMGPEAATAMAAALVSNRHLNYLYLPHNSIGDQGLVEICESLKRNRSLIGLDLELNHIENAQSLVGMTAMSEVLRTNRTLREINLAYNLFSGDAIRELMKGVAVNTTLESINFTNCGISTEGAMAIAEVLPSARGLQNLGLTSNPDIAVEGYWALSTSLAKNRSMKGIQLDYNSEDRYVLYEAVQRLLTRNFIWQQAIYAAACRILVLSRVVLLGRPVNQRLSQSQLQQQQQQQSRGGGPWSLIKKKVGLVRTNSSTSYSSLMTINKTRAASPDVHSGNASPLLLTVESMGRAAATASQDRDEREPGSESVQNLAHGNRPLTPTTSLGVLVPPGLGRDLDLGLGVRLEVMGGGTTSSRNSTSSRSNSIRRGIHPLDPGPVSPPSMASSPSFYNIDYQEPYNAHKVMANLGNMPYEIFETICAFLDPGRTMTIAQIRATIQAGGDRSTLVGYSTKDLMLERIFQSRYISPFGMRYSVKNGEERP